MFTEKEINEWQKIKAPENLVSSFEEMGIKNNRNRIINNSIKMISAVAACLLIAVAVSVFVRIPRTTILVNGQTLIDSVSFYDISPLDKNSLDGISPASEMQRSLGFSIPIELQVNGETKVSVNCGSLINEKGSSAKSVSLKDDSMLYWEISYTEDLSKCELEIDDGKKIIHVALSYDQAKNIITATKN